MQKADSFEKGTILDISNQGLSMLPDLQAQLHLQELRAENNNLTALNKLPNSLKYLFLNHNRIAFVGTLHELVPHLKVLDLSDNRLISLDGISNCIELSELNIANNYVGDDQISQIRNLEELTKLDLSHNHLRDESLVNMLKELRNLEELWNSSNDFTEISFGFGMKKLGTLCLDANKLKVLEFTEVMPMLNVLSVRENSLGCIYGVSNLVEVKEIYADGNDFIELTEEWGTLKNLSVLSLKYNHISKFPALQNLQILDLSHNSLTDIQFLPETLTELYISHNCLTEIPKLSSLITLDISHNKVPNLSFISSSTELQLLNASYNELDDPVLALTHLKQCSKLVIIDLKGCPFKPQHRLMFICSFLNTLQEINGVAVTTEEKKRAIDEQEISFEVTPTSFIKGQHSIKSSIASQDNLTLSPSPGGSWDARARNPHFPSMRSSLTHSAQGSADFAMFEKRTPRNSLASNMSPYSESIHNEGFKGSNLKFTSSPENQKHMLTSNLNSPFPAENASRVGSSAFLPLQPDHLRSFSGTNMSPFPNLTDKSMISEGNFQYEQSPLDRKLFENITPKKNLSHTFSQQLETDISDITQNKSDTVMVINQDYKPQKDEEDIEIQEKLLKLEEETRELIRPGNLFQPTYETDSSAMSKDLDRIYNTMMENMKSDSHRYREKNLPPKHPLKMNEDLRISHEDTKQRKGRTESSERKILEDIPNYENKRRKSHCCKHHHHRHHSSKKKSVKLQTDLETFKGSENVNRKIKINTNLPRYIDQATSPPHEYVSTLLEKYKKQSFFEPDKSVSSIDSELKQLDDLPSISSGRESRESFLTENEQNLGTTFAADRGLKFPSMKLDPNADFNKLLLYAQTPPRPILTSEASIPIIHELSQKGGEYYLICQLFLKENCEVKNATKIFTFSLQKQLKEEIDFNLSCRGLEYTKTTLMFHPGTPTKLEKLYKNPQGFITYMNDQDSMIFSSSLRCADDLYSQKYKIPTKGTRQIVIALISSGSLRRINGNIYCLEDLSKAAPAYLIEYTLK
ncbi:unnamed protein product [Blepharisma stoltei]|uniref:Leucine-rich repeat-containing protein n=1 Tax=Blepharisma stoltei TaxID=1481888 RepID=A0AAU9K3G0_9CILI|nr:unnamed protein product [Blepharisma stoltei]